MIGTNANSEPLAPAVRGSFFEVFVPGNPCPQGSKRHVGGGVMIESCKNLKFWRSDLRTAMAASLPANWDRNGTMRVVLDFTFDRPKSHFNASGSLTKRAPLDYLVKKNDIDKLSRAVLDAMTCYAYNDDCQVVSLTATRRYAEDWERQGVKICVIRLR